MGGDGFALLLPDKFNPSKEQDFPGTGVAAASLLGVDSYEKKGKTYYAVEVLTRTADGDEGGRHQLITAVVSGGNEYVLKVQVGDKRWFKGLERPAKEVSKSFTVA